MTKYRIFHPLTQKYVQPESIGVRVSARYLVIDCGDDCETHFEFTGGDCGPLRHVNTGHYVIRDMHDDLMLCDGETMSHFQYETGMQRFKSIEEPQGYWYCDDNNHRCTVTVPTSENNCDAFTFILVPVEVA